MMKRKEAEDGIRHFSIEWMHETNYCPKPGHYPSFSDFKQWLEKHHRSLYLNFRSQIGAENEAEQWFESEIDRYWRNRRS